MSIDTAAGSDAILDPTTAERIEIMVNALPDLRHSRCHGRGRYPAHLKLAAYNDRVDVGDLDAALATATGSWEQLHLTLAGIVVLPGRPVKLCLAVVPTLELMARHATLHRSLADLASHPECEIGAWLPHVVVGETDLLAEAVEVLTALWTGPLAATVVSLDLVVEQSGEVLSSRLLRG